MPFVSRVDNSEMASGSVVPPLHLIGAATADGGRMLELAQGDTGVDGVSTSTKDNRKRAGKKIHQSQKMKNSHPHNMPQNRRLTRDKKLTGLPSPKKKTRGAGERTERETHEVR